MKLNELGDNTWKDVTVAVVLCKMEKLRSAG